MPRNWHSLLNQSQPVPLDDSSASAHLHQSHKQHTNLTCAGQGPWGSPGTGRCGPARGTQHPASRQPPARTAAASAPAEAQHKHLAVTAMCTGPGASCHQPQHASPYCAAAHTVPLCRKGKLAPPRDCCKRRCIPHSQAHRCSSHHRTMPLPIKQSPLPLCHPCLITQLDNSKRNSINPVSPPGTALPAAAL